MSRRERIQFYAAVTVLAVLVTAVFTYPLIFQWRTHIPGFTVSDGINHTWATWWFDKALTDLKQSPADLNMIYYPVGTYHPKVIASPWAKLVAFPFVHQGINPFAIYNLHLFISYVLTWLFTSIFCLELTGRRSAAIVGGLIFTFGISRTLHVLTGHFTQILTYPQPLLALTIWYAWQKPTVRRGLLFGGALILASIVDLMPLAYVVGPLLLAMLIYFLLRDHRRFFARPFLLSLGVGFGLAALVVIPLFWPLLVGSAQGDLDWYAAQGWLDYSADLLALFTPPYQHPLLQVWPTLSRFSDEVHLLGATEGAIYAGWITLLLAGTAVVKLWEQRPDIRLWATFAIVTFTFALGPLLRVKGELIQIGTEHIVLPHALLMYVPLLSWGRTPARFNLATMFAIAILAAYGVAWFMQRISQPQWRFAALIGLMSLITLDSVLIYPWPMRPINAPIFYETVAADTRSVAIMDLPIVGYRVVKNHMLYQMTHGHAIVGGFRDRRPPDAEAAMLALAELAQPGGDPAALAEYGVAYIVLHEQFLEPEELAETAVFLTDQLGPPLYEDDVITAFAVPNALQIAPPPLKMTRR